MASVLRKRLRDLRGGNLRLTQLHQSEAAVSAYSALRASLSRVGLQVVVKSFYSPIPDLKSLSPEVWERTSALGGIELDLDRQLALLEDELAAYLCEFDPPRAATPGRYHLANPSYGPGDGETLYALVRHGKPRRIVELGSGFTTLAMAEAATANAREERPVELQVYDPYPGVASPDTPGVAALEALSAQDVPLEVFDRLGPGDMLVVDTTHTVKVGGDVNRIVLDVLPRLRAGVLVHFHDVFLPYEYPRRWAERYGLFWSEQYLLQAFLAFNRDFEVVLALHALVRKQPEPLRALIPSLGADAAPGAFWIRRTRADTG